MSMSLLNTLVTVMRWISSNLLRTALTTLGIIIGVASVIATLALGNGARASVEANFRFLGSDQIQLDQDLQMDSGKMKAAGKPLTYEDGVGIPEAASLVDRVEMRVSGNAKLRHGRETIDLNFQGTDAGALLSVIAEGQVQPVGWSADKPLTPDAFLGQGRFFTDAEELSGDSVCVLGYQTALDLFQGDDPIGQTLWVNRKPCQVIGVLTELEAVTVQDRINTRPNEGLFLPISFAIQNLFEEEPWVTVIAHVKDETKMEEAKAQIAAYLRQRHGITQDADGTYADDFHMTTKQDVLGAQLQSAATFSLLLTALAGVSLAVGGILGIAVGVLTVPIAASLSQGAALLDPRSIPLAFGVSLATGLMFALYPALRASRLDPIEALRYE